MKIDRKSKYFLVSACAFGVVAASIILLSFMQNLSYIRQIFLKLMNVLAPFFYGFAIAYVLNYPYRWLLSQFSKRMQKKSGKQGLSAGKRIAAISIIYSLFLVFLGTFFYIAAPQIVNALSSFAQTLPFYVERVSQELQGILTNYLGRFRIAPESMDAILDTLGETFTARLQTQEMVDWAAGKFAGAAAGVKNFLLGIMISVYFLFDKELFKRTGKKFLYALFRPQTAEHILDILYFTDKTFGGFIIAKVTDAMIIGVLCYFGMMILKLDFAVLISVIVGVTNMIPFLGPFIGAVPSVLLLFSVSPWQALVLLIFIIVLQQFDGNFLEPKLMSNSLGIRAFYVVFAVLVGGGLFGILGMFIGVPLFAVLYALAGSFINARLIKKNIEMK